MSHPGHSRFNIKVIILSDSQSALKAIKQFRNPHPLVEEIIRLISYCGERLTLHMKWIRGHTDIAGNERADKLAKSGADFSPFDSIYDSFPLSFAKNQFKSVLYNEWEDWWRTTTKASQTKDFIPNIKHRLDCKTLSPNYVITQYLSGHGNFNSYLKRFHLTSSDMCLCGEDIETPIHVIYDCKLYAEQRFPFLNAIHRRGHSFIPLDRLISDQNLYKHLIQFLKQIKF